MNYKKDGTPFWNALFMGPIVDRDGRLVHFFASQLDITRRRTSEQAFRQAQKMEAIGQLTAGLAHDFNNLLQVVMGNLEIGLNEAASLGPGKAGEVLRDGLASADRATQQAATLTQQLLAFARKTRLEPRPTDLNVLVPAFSEMLARTLGDHVSLRLDLAIRAQRSWSGRPNPSLPPSPTGSSLGGEDGYRTTAGGTFLDVSEDASSLTIFIGDDSFDLLDVGNVSRVDRA